MDPLVADIMRRSIFQELSQAMDAESVYQSRDHTDDDVRLDPDMLKEVKNLSNAAAAIRGELHSQFDLYRSASRQRTELLKQMSAVRGVIRAFDRPDMAPGEERLLAALRAYLDDEDIQCQLRKESAAEKQHWQAFAQLRDALDVTRGVQVNPICHMCCERLVDHAMIPCGHTYCSQCSHIVQECPTCRGAIADRMKIFL